jgi:hypothetical protein
LARRTLDYDLSYDFSLIGISSQLKPHSAAWWINKTLEIELECTDPLELLLPKTEILAWFPRYVYEVKDLEASLFLLSNAGTQGFLVPEFKELDYFLLFEGESGSLLSPDLIRSLKTIKLFQAVTEVDVNQKLRSKTHLVF